MLMLCQILLCAKRAEVALSGGYALSPTAKLSSIPLTRAKREGGAKRSVAISEPI